MSWNIEKPGDRINGPVTITGNTTLTGAATISGDLTVDTSTLKVDSTNNRVGVGTASPSVPLDVVGNAKISGDLVVDTNTLVVDSTNNRLGIGTASPADYLEVVGSGSNGIRVSRNGALTQYLSLSSGSTGPSINASSGIGEISFGINGSTKATLDSSGRLGIGTASPSAALSVSASPDATYNCQVLIGNTGGVNQKLVFNPTVSSGIGGLTDGSLAFYANAANTERMRLDASGRLGIGTASPTATVEVKTAGSAGSAYISADSTGGSFRASGHVQFYTDNAVYDTIWYKANKGSLNMRLTDDGNLLFKTNGTASAPTIANADNPDTGLYWPTDADTLALAVGGSDAVYIDSSRNVGIGITPGYKLDIRDNSTGLLTRWSSSSTGGTSIQFVNTATNGRTYRIGSNFVSGQGEFAIYDDTAGAERLRIKSTGQINFTPLNADPAGASPGDVYYNSSTNKLRCYNGTSWNDLF